MTLFDSDPFIENPSLIPPLPDVSDGALLDDLEGLTLYEPLGIKKRPAIQVLNQETMTRLVNKEGPIQDHDIEDNTHTIELIRQRNLQTNADLVESMRTIDALVDTQKTDALKDREAAHAEKEREIEHIEEQKAQLIRCVEAWASTQTEAVIDGLKTRVALNTRIRSTVERMRDNGVRAFGNIYRTVNHIEALLNKHEADADSAVVQAASQVERKAVVDAALLQVREELAKNDAALAALRRREEELPIERSALEAEERVERGKLIRDIILEHKEEFEALKDDQDALFEKQEEYLQKITPVRLAAITGKLTQNDLEMSAIQAAIKSCVSLIAANAADIHALENSLREIPALLLNAHDTFEEAACSIEKTALPSYGAALHASSLGPIAEGTLRITADDAAKYGVLTLSNDAAELHYLLAQRKSLLQQKNFVDFDPVHDVPELFNLDGTPIIIETQGFESETDQNGEDAERPEHRLYRKAKQFGRNFFAAFKVEPPSHAKNVPHEALALEQSNKSTT